MIAIVNRTEKLGEGEYGKGKQIYECRINDMKPFFYFEHNFEDGLSACLYNAYVAACEFEKNEMKGRSTTTSKKWPY